MANTYTEMHFQFVFAVRNRDAVIKSTWKDDLHKYITGIIQKRDHKVLQINGVPDHVHVLVGMRPTQSVSDLMKDVKQGSSWWINENRLTNTPFVWQEGYGAFTYAKRQLDTVIDYILRQEEHHRTKTFLEEYVELLEEFGVDYDRRYIFKDLI